MLSQIYYLASSQTLVNLRGCANQARVRRRPPVLSHLPHLIHSQQTLSPRSGPRQPPLPICSLTHSYPKQAISLANFAVLSSPRSVASTQTTPPPSLNCCFTPSVSSRVPGVRRALKYHHVCLGPILRGNRPRRKKASEALRNLICLWHGRVPYKVRLPTNCYDFARELMGCRGEVLDSVLYRTGLLAALRSKAKGGQVIGVMITASHNPAEVGTLIQEH